MRHKVRRVEVIVDPGLLSSLLEVAVDWAAEQGQRIQITLHIKNWPEHDVLMFKATQHLVVAASNDDPVDPDSLNWHLLEQIAQVMGVTSRRIMTADHASVRTEFPRTVKQLESLPATEVDAGGDSSFYLTEGKPLAGPRLLLVTTDEQLRWVIKDVCGTRGADLRYDTEHCPGDPVLRTRQTAHDRHRQKPAKPSVRGTAAGSGARRHQLSIHKNCQDSHTFEMANWMGGSISRISHDA